MSVSNGRRGGKSVPRHGQIDVPNMLSEIIESHLSAPNNSQSSEAATLGGLDASAYVPYLNADKNVDLNGHNITGNSDGALSTPGDDTAVPSQKAVKTYVPNAPLAGLAVEAGTVTSASTIVQAMGHLEYRVALDDAKVSFPGFGTTHALAAYGDHAHAGVYAAIGQTFYLGTTSVAVNRVSAPIALTGITSVEDLYFDAANHRVGILNSSPLAPLHVGANNENNSSDCVVLISRAVDDSVSGNGHAFSDSSRITRSGVVAYNSFDGRVKISGTSDYDHYALFQNGAVYESSGTMTYMYGMKSNPTISDGVITNLYAVYHKGSISLGSTVTNSYALYADDPSGSGDLVNNYGFYCAPLEAGSGQNYAIYTAGAGRVYIGDSTAAASQSSAAVVIAGGLGVGGSVHCSSVVMSHGSGAYALSLRPPDAYTVAQISRIGFTPKYNSSDGITTCAEITFSRVSTTDVSYDSQIEFRTRATGGSLTTRVTVDKDGKLNVANLTASRLVQTDANKNLVSATPAAAPTAAATAPSTAAGTYGWDTDAHRLTLTTAVSNLQTRMAEVISALQAIKAMN